MIGYEIAAVQQGIDRASAGKIVLVKQHENRLFAFRLFRRNADVQGRAVLALPVMLQERTLMFDLYGRSAEMLCLKYSLRCVKRFGCLPSALANWRLCVRTGR